MARYYGKIGYTQEDQVETAPGVWKDVPIERNYYGDILRISRSQETGGDKINGDINITNSFSIVADAFALDNIFAMRYIIWMGQYWSISTVEVQRPRLIIRIGGLYHGEKA